MSLPEPHVDLLGQSAKATANAIARQSNALSKGARLGDAQVAEAAVEFEAIFLSQMLAPMFENLSTDGLFGGGSGERIYRSLLVQEYGKALARSGGVGIADSVQREILKLQEIQE